MLPPQYLHFKLHIGVTIIVQSTMKKKMKFNTFVMKKEQRGKFYKDLEFNYDEN